MDLFGARCKRAVGVSRPLTEIESSSLHTAVKDSALFLLIQSQYSSLFYSKLTRLYLGHYIHHERHPIEFNFIELNQIFEEEEEEEEEEEAIC